MYLTFVLQFLCLGLAVGAVQVANLNITREVAAEYGCTGKCYERFRVGLASDRGAFGTTFDVGFYATASNFSTSQPGDALKLAPIDPNHLHGIPPGTTAYKFQYVSMDLQGKKVPATGFIAFPWASRTNTHNYAAVAYGHGTSGVFRGCAPSTMPTLYEYSSWSHLLLRGYAVIATDYAGLGNNYTAHQYVASPAQANDLYYSVAAARKLFPDHLTLEWMSVGHSEGGGAVWALAESPLLKENPLKLGSYLGTVAQAPATRILQLALSAISSPSSNSSSSSGASGELAELSWLVFGLRSILPNDTQTWLKPVYRKRLELMELAQGCYDSAEALVTDLSIERCVDLANPALFNAFNVLQNLTARGTAKSEQPVLVVQGLADTSVPPVAAELSYAVGCKMGNRIQLQLYPGVDHDPVIPVSAPYFLQWMDDRFNGANETEPRCSNITVKPFNPRYVYAPFDTD